jgi:hypothetical protein
MPNIIGLLGHSDPLVLNWPIGCVEQAQLDAGGVLREEREIDALAIPGGTQRVGLARPDRGHLIVSWLDFSSALHKQLRYIKRNLKG